MADGQQQPDWFEQNAPPKAPPKAAEQDWFAANAPNKTASATEEPSTYQKLTATDRPEERNLPAPVRFLANAGGAAMSVPGAVASSFAHPIETAKGMAGQVKEAYKYYAPASIGGDPNQHPNWEAMKSVAPEALGSATGQVAGGEALGIAQKAALKPVANVAGAALKSIPDIGKFAERSAPRLEQAGIEARATVNNSLKAAEARVAPLYENMEKADQDALAASGKPGSVDISGASKALDAARKKMYGDEPGPKVVQKEGEKLQQYAPNATTSLADMKTARALRSQLSDEIGSAINKGDRQTASALTAAKTEVTNAMAARAKELGLEKDFNTADPQWREIQQHRERLGPLTQQENSAKLFETYKNGSPELRNSLDALDKAGLLDKGRLDFLSKNAERVAPTKGFQPWIKRAAYGVVPVAIAEKAGILPKLPVSPYIVGGVASTLGAGLYHRLMGEYGLSQLPELESKGPGLRAVTPSTPTLPTIPPAAGPRALPPGPTPGGIPPMSDAATLRMRVPLSEQPTQFEKPFENMLEQVRKETAENPKGAENEAALKQQLTDQSQKTLTKARTEEAMQPFKQQPLGKQLFTQTPGELPKVPSATIKPQSLGDVPTAPAPAQTPREAQAELDRLRSQRNRTNDPAKWKKLEDKYQAAKEKFYAGKEQAEAAAPAPAAPELPTVNKPVDTWKRTAEAAPKASRSPVFDSMPKDQQWISQWAKEIGKMPQAGREAEMKELQKYGGQGTLLKERIAMQHAERTKNYSSPEWQWQQAQESGEEPDQGPTPPGMGGASAEAARAERAQYEARRGRQARKRKPNRGPGEE